MLILPLYITCGLLSNPKLSMGQSPYQDMNLWSISLSDSLSLWLPGYSQRMLVCEWLLSPCLVYTWKFRNKDHKQIHLRYALEVRFEVSAPPHPSPEGGPQSGGLQGRPEPLGFASCKENGSSQTGPPPSPPLPAPGSPSLPLFLSFSSLSLCFSPFFLCTPLTCSIPQKGFHVLFGKKNQRACSFRRSIASLPC